MMMMMMIVIWGTKATTLELEPLWQVTWPLCCFLAVHWNYLLCRQDANLRLVGQQEPLVKVFLRDLGPAAFCFEVIWSDSCRLVKGTLWTHWYKGWVQLGSRLRIQIHILVAWTIGTSTVKHVYLYILVKVLSRPSLRSLEGKVEAAGLVFGDL